MSTIQFTHLTDKELVAEAVWQLHHNEAGMTLPAQLELVSRFAQYADNERVAYKKVDHKQLELPL